MRYSYFVNGYAVRSELPLPADAAYLPPDQECPDCMETPPITICRVPSGSLHGFAQKTPLAGGGVRTFRVETGVLLCVEPDLRFLINDDGTHIQVEAPALSLQAAGSYLVGPGLSLCALLRGETPLHAAGMEIEGKRFGLLAPSGTGKSTTLWQLLEDGARFANDDMIPVRFQNGNAMAAASGSLFPKVDAELLVRGGKGATALSLPEVLPGNGKFWYPLSSQQRAVGERPLSALFLLEPEAPEASRESTVTITRVYGSVAASLLLKNLMAPKTAAALLGISRLLEGAAALAKAVPVYRTRYPKRLELLPELSHRIRETLS